MQVEKISQEDVGNYLYALKTYIQTTINLPVEAITQYCEQWNEDRLSLNLDSWLFLAAKKHNKIEGVLMGTPIEGGVATIIWVLVDKQSQSNGIGSRLFKQACVEYKKRGAHKIKLTVPDFKTVNFYLKQDMLLEGTHRNHWWGADFWAMGKIL